MKDLFTKIRQDPKYATTRILAAIIRRCQCSWLKKKNMYQTKTYTYSHAAFKRLSTVNYFDKKAPL